MDVNNVFLHGQLIKTVYMMQPLDFKDTSKRDYVCRLRKIIYGLKQTPKARIYDLKKCLASAWFSKCINLFFLVYF